MRVHDRVFLALIRDRKKVKSGEQVLNLFVLGRVHTGLRTEQRRSGCIVVLFKAPQKKAASSQKYDGIGVNWCRRNHYENRVLLLTRHALIVSDSQNIGQKLAHLFIQNHKKSS